MKELFLELSKFNIIVLAILILIFSYYPSSTLAQTSIEGELKKWHKVSLVFEGPETSETADPNPFTDFNLEVSFTHEGTTYKVPGYYAADGDAANTSAESGNKWVVHFTADKIGKWEYSVSFKQGKDVAINGGGVSGGFMDGETGNFTITNSDKQGRDLRAKGRLQVVGKHYLQFAENKEWFIKGGPDSPENMLAYDEFDETPTGEFTKNWEPHAGDYDDQDASEYTWNNGKGKNILGVVNYLSGRGLNAFSFLTFNLGSTDGTVFPHLQNGGKTWDSVYHDRFDISKMAQWEKVFEYADKKGMFLHIKTQDWKNSILMDGGEVDRERKLYYRELIARYSHHLALNWNLGERNEQNLDQRIAMAQYFEDRDPYKHLVVIHTYKTDQYFYGQMIGDNSALTGASLQSDLETIHTDVKKWVEDSREAGKPWVVSNDDQHPDEFGVNKDPHQREIVRNYVLWGTLMAGGIGAEYTYGWGSGCHDFDCQNHRTRENKYRDVVHALNFFQTYFQQYLPDVINENEATPDSIDYVLRTEDQSAYAIYRPNGGITSIALPDSNYTVSWYNPRNGRIGEAIVLTDSILEAPDDSDWVALITNSEAPEASPPPACKEFVEVDGLVIMEAENTQSDYGLWIKKTDVKGHTGSGHLEFTGNRQEDGPASSPLKYTFTINKPGFYTLTIRARKRIVNSNRNDISNDGYVRMEGDFSEGPNAGDKHKDDAKLEFLQQDIKMFGGNANGWGWARELDLGGHGNKRFPVYAFKAGETYTLTISGRSKHWNIDRIILYHESISRNAAQRASNEETVCEEVPIPEPIPGANAQISIMLEGFMNKDNSKMYTRLLEKGLLPIEQPFTTAPFNYNGTEKIITPDPETADWIYVELRDTVNPSIIIARQAAIITYDGIAQSVNQENELTFPELIPGSYYVAIYHKSHIPVISSKPIEFKAENPLLYDFSTGVDKVDGNHQLKNINEIYVMYCGDFDQNCVINNQDYNLWHSNPAAIDVYLPMDANGDGIINNQDYNLWKKNASKIGLQSLKK